MMAIVWFILIVIVGFLMAKSYQQMKNKSHYHLSKVILGLSSAVCWWLFCELMQQLMLWETGIIIFHELKFIGIISIPGMLLSFGIELYYNRRKSKVQIGLTIIFPIVFWLLIATNHLHHWFRQSIEVAIGVVNIVTVKNGPVYFLMVAYTYLLILCSLCLVMRFFYQQPKIYRKRVGILLIGIIFSVLMNVAYQILQPLINLNFDFTPISFGLVSWMFYYAFYVYKSDGMAKIAKDFVLNQLEMGILFLDREENIFFTNGYFNQIVNKKETKVIEGHLMDLSDDLQKVIHKARDEGERQIYKTTSFDKISIYSVDVQSIDDDKERYLGGLVTLKNVTEEYQRIVQLEIEKEYAMVMDQPGQA